jgi:hypothetical protein
VISAGLFHRLQIMCFAISKEPAFTAADHDILRRDGVQYCLNRSGAKAAEKASSEQYCREPVIDQASTELESNSIESAA